MSEYQPRWVLFCKTFGFALDAAPAADYIAWINKHASAYKAEKQVPAILDHDGFDAYLCDAAKKETCNEKI